MVRVAAAGAALTLLLAACGASATPAPQSLTPVESGPAASASDDSGLTPPPGGNEGAQATVVALNIAFEPTQLQAPAGQPITIALDNKDAGIPHNLMVSDANGPIAKTEIVTGPARALLTLGPLAAGSYAFACEIHPNMAGTLVVGP